MVCSKPTRMQNFRLHVLNLPRSYKQATMILSDIAGVSVCGWASVWVATGTRQLGTPDVVLLTLLVLVVTVPVAWHMGLYRSIVRYMGADLFVAGSKTALAVATLIGLLVYAGDLVSAPLRWSISFFALSLIHIVGSRFLARVFLNRRNLDREPVIVYGAGEGGARLVASLKGGDDFIPI